MNYIDIIIVVLLILSAISGLTKGFIYEFASLFGLIAGVWGAIKFSGAVRDFLEYRLNFDHSSVQIVAFVLTFVVIIIIVHFIAKAIEKAMESVSLGVVNRIFGGIFAVFKSAFILGVLFLLIQRIDESVPFIPENDIQKSHLYNPLRNVAVYSFPFLKGIYDDIKDTDHKPKDKEVKAEQDTVPTT
jgi:membrane protein required for colicin V production